MHLSKRSYALTTSQLKKYRISIAWATNIPPPSETTTTEITGTTPTPGPTEPPTTSNKQKI